MSQSIATSVPGRIASLHLHPPEPDVPFLDTEFFEAVAGKGITGDHRYFERLSRTTGLPSRRQITLMAREEIAEHAATLGLQSIAPGAVRSNIETTGIRLLDLLNQQVVVGEAILYFYEDRKPCHKMDSLCQGLRGLMENSRQGVMAEVLKSGRIRIGDAIRPALPAERLIG